MSCRVYPSVSLPELLDALLPFVKEQLRASREKTQVLEPLMLVVPGTLVADWIQQKIATRLGICMGIEFFRPQQFIERILSLASGASRQEDDPWLKEALCWRILPMVPDYAGEMGIRDATTLSLRERFALAELIADRFDQYAHFRPELIKAWYRNTPAPSSSNADDIVRNAERWQRKLWRKLSNEIAELGTGRQNPVFELDRVFEILNASTGVATPRKVFVLGSGMLDPLLVDVLARLDKAGWEVEVHMIFPCLSYLGDLSRKASWEALRSDSDLEIPEAGHPLAASLGRQSIGAFLLLGRLDEQYTHWPEPQVEPNGATASCLLHQIQLDLRQSRTPRPDEPGRLEFSASDKSLTIHSCYSPRRELEVLRDELLRAFAEVPDLKPHEVMVVSSDLTHYAPLAATVLAQGEPALPVQLTTTPLAHTDIYAEALVSLLDFGLTRLSASGLLALLELKAVQLRLGLDADSQELERLRDWIHRSGLTFGLDEDHRKSLGVESDAIGSWRFALDRLIGGQWFGDEAMAIDAKGKYLHPVAGALGDEELKKTEFLTWLCQLFEQIRDWSTVASGEKWSRRLDKAVDSLLGQDGEHECSPHLLNLICQLRQHACETSLDLATVRDWLSGEVEKTEGHRRAIAGRIAFGQINQLRNIPCRVLAMVGMQDSSFPRQNRQPAWDLLRLQPARWDRDLREEDRQGFLDCLLMAQDRLIITATNRNIRSGKEEAFSSCVDDLLRVAEKSVVVSDSGNVKLRKALVVRHRLLPFHIGYFQNQSGEEYLPASYNSMAVEVARDLHNNGSARNPLPLYVPASKKKKGGRANDQLHTEIRLDALAQFWKNPARAWLKAQRIALPEEMPDESVLDQAPLDLDGLESWKVKDAVLQAAIQSCDPDFVRQQLGADRKLPPSWLGIESWSSLVAKAMPVANRVKQILESSQKRELRVDLCSGVSVAGLITLAREGQVELAPSWRMGKFTEHRHFLEAWLSALLGAAADHKHLVLLLGEDKDGDYLEKYLSLPDVDEAKRTLQALVDGYEAGQQGLLCFALKTSAKIAEQQRKSGAVDFDEINDYWLDDGFAGPPGDGLDPSTNLAWRDREPFTAELQQEWLDWSLRVSEPLSRWSESSAELAPVVAKTKKGGHP